MSILYFKNKINTMQCHFMNMQLLVDNNNLEKDILFVISHTYFLLEPYMEVFTELHSL